MKRSIKNWIMRPSPKAQRMGTGWMRQLDKVYVDEELGYVVMTRTLNTEMGKVIHATITTNHKQDIPWREKQRIKNELFGEQATAIEVFPAERDLVDQADMYHFWVLEKRLPFGIDENIEGN